MSIFFYALREFDELPCAERASREMNVRFGWSAAYPEPANY